MITRRAVGLVVLASLFALYGVFLLRSGSAPVRAFAFVDFYDYYYAAIEIRAGRDPYDGAATEALARAAGVPTIPGSDYIYPPWFATLLVPLTFVEPRTAAALWFAAGAAALLASLTGSPARAGWLVALGAALFPPVLFSLFVGQVNVLLIALVVAAWRWRARRPALAGVAIGLAAAVKLSPAILLVDLVARRRWWSVSAAVLTLLSCALVGELVVPGGLVRLFRTALPAAIADPARLAHPVNQGVAGFLARLLAPNPWTEPWLRAPGLVIPLATALSCGLLATTLALLERAREPSERSEARAWSALLVWSVVASPLAWESTFALLLLPMGLLVIAGANPRCIFASWTLVAAQRGLDDFALAPDAHPFLRSAAPITSLALWGALVLLVTSFRRPPVEPGSLADRSVARGSQVLPGHPPN